MSKRRIQVGTEIKVSMNNSTPEEECPEKQFKGFDEQGKIVCMDRSKWNYGTLYLGGDIHYLSPDNTEVFLIAPPCPPPAPVVKRPLYVGTEILVAIDASEVPHTKVKFLRWGKVSKDYVGMKTTVVDETKQRWDRATFLDGTLINSETTQVISKIESVALDDTSDLEIVDTVTYAEPVTPPVPPLAVGTPALIPAQLPSVAENSPEYKRLTMEQAFTKFMGGDEIYDEFARPVEAMKREGNYYVLNPKKYLFAYCYKNTGEVHVSRHKYLDGDDFIGRNNHNQYKWYERVAHSGERDE